VRSKRNFFSSQFKAGGEKSRGEEKGTATKKKVRDAGRDRNASRARGSHKSVVWAKHPPTTWATGAKGEPLESGKGGRRNQGESKNWEKKGRDCREFGENNRNP